MEKVTANLLAKAYKNIQQFVKRRNKALGLTTIEVKGDNLVRVFPDGKVEVIGKPLFGMTKVTTKRIKLNREG